MNLKDQRLAELRQRVRQCSPAEAHRRQRDGALLIDVREADEVAAGSPSGALRLGRGFLELSIERHASTSDAELLVLCGGGVRSLFAADDLQRLGYTNVVSVDGGYRDWQAAGLPCEVPEQLDALARQRYARHLAIPEVGEAGQLRLRRARVLLIGAGGLGSPAALYLAAAGVGTLGIVDDDVVDRSNLQRQILHGEDTIGQPKTESARRTLERLNPDVEIRAIQRRLTAECVEEVFAGYDVVVDGADNFATRYLINDACVKLGLPNVHGSIYRFEGQVTVLWPARLGAARGPCYRCLYPEPPPPELAPSCAEAGVLGVLPGVIGTLQAVETIKILLGRGDPLVGRLLVYDALRAAFMEVGQRPDPNCRCCAEGAPFPGYSEVDPGCRPAES